MTKGGRGKGEEGRGWLRLLFLLSFFLFPFSLRAQNALILIQHDAARPNLPTEDFFYEQWIRWPTDQAGLNNRILSLAAGVDLQAEPADMGFKEVGGGARATSNGRSLEARGFFEAREKYLGRLGTSVVTKPKGGVSPSILLLALDDPGRRIQPRPFGAALPSQGLVLYEAAGWKDAFAIADRISERALIVEYPPDGEDGWSRFWLRGAWPRGVPTEPDLNVPGLIRARSALGMLLRPERFTWHAANAGQWGGPNRWLEHGHRESERVLGTWFGLAAFVIAWGLAQVMNEDRGPFVSEMLVLVALSPAAIVLAGAAQRFGGLEAWPLWLVLASVGLYGASLLLGMIVRRSAPSAHPLWAASLVGLATLLAFDPLWSDFSGRFSGLDLDVPGQALGATIAYGAGAMAFAPGRWPGRALAATLLLWGATDRPWWIGGHAALLVLPALALVASEGSFRPAFLAVLALLPTGLVAITRNGVAWSPGGLVRFADESGALDLWRTAVLLLSPQWVATLTFFAIIALVGNRFLAYRLRKLLRLDPRLRVLPWLTAATMALGITEPLAIPAAPVVAFGALIVLAFDGLRANA